MAAEYSLSCFDLDEESDFKNYTFNLANVVHDTQP